MCPADTPADAPVDDLQRMLADKAARRVADEQTRMRIAAEVDVAMDNGVHINPLLRQVYGERSSEAQGQEREEINQWVRRLRWMAKWLLCAAEDRALWANKRQMICVCERDREVCAVELV